MKIPIKKYIDNISLSWEERYRRLEEHHLEETSWMIGEIQHLEGKWTHANEAYRVLEDSIKKHREQTGHNMCWENDQELWSVLNDGVKTDHTPPKWDEFMIKCVEYRKSRE